MKKIKGIIAILIIACAALLLVYTMNAGRDVGTLLNFIDGGSDQISDEKMLKARNKVTAADQAGDRDKTLRTLDKYTETYQDRLKQGASLALFVFKNGSSLTAGAIFLMVAGLAILVSAFDRSGKYHKPLIGLVLFFALYALVYILENTVGANSMLLMVLKKGVIYALIAVSMNLLNGFTGLFSLGQAGFMLVGAYTYAILTIAPQDRLQVYQYYAGGLVQFQLPALVSLVIAGVVAAFFAALIGLPVLRLKSDYLAIATLGFAEIIRAVLQYDGLGPITNGSNLLRKFTTFHTVLFPFLVAGVCIALIVLLIHSTYGRSFIAIRDDEVAAEAMGINLFKHKQMAFVISSFFAGIGGALLAMYQTTVQAGAFKASMTYEILLIVVIGGLGSVTGSILSSFLFVALSEWWLRFLDNEAVIGTFQIPFMRSGFRMVVFSVVIMIIVLFYRRGIMGDKEWSLDGLMRLFKKKGRDDRV